jgi:hypothetical protein
VARIWIERLDGAAARQGKTKIISWSRVREVRPDAIIVDPD